MPQPGRTTTRASLFARSPAATAAALYVLLTVLSTYPLSVHPAATTFPGGSDRNLYVWTLAWNAHAFLTDPLRIFDANIFFPYHRTLAYSENLIGASLLVAPVQWLLQDPWLTFNLGVLLTIPLSALGAFVLARRLELGVTAAWICGLIYGFAPPRFLRLDQAHLTAVEWIPFCLAYVHTYAARGRRADLRIAIAFLSVQVVTSGHGAVFLLFALTLLAVSAVATGSRPNPLRWLRDAGVPGALLLTPVVLVFLPYRAVQLEVGLRRELTDWSGSWASFLSSPTHVDAFILDHLGPFGAWVNTATQAYLFPGYVPLLLAAAAFVGTRRSRPRPVAGRRWTWLALLLDTLTVCAAGVALYALVNDVTRIDLAGLVISMRAPWRTWLLVALLAAARAALVRRVPFNFMTRVVHVTHLWAARKGDLRTFYLVLVLLCMVLAIGPPYGPWRFLYALPGLSFIRVPSRFMILAMLGCGVLGAFGFERLTSRLTPRATLWCGLLVTAALVGEFSVAPFDVVPSPSVIPAADRWLASEPHPLVVAELPPMDPTIPMLHSMAHWQKTVHGYSGWNPALTQEIASALTTFPDEAGMALLRRVGVTHIVVHTAMYEPGQWRAMDEKLQAWSAQLTLRYKDAEGRVYTLEPARAANAQAPSSATSTRTWQPSSRVSVDPGSTSAGRKPAGD